MNKLLLVCIFKDDSEFDSIERMLKSFMPFMSGLCALITGQGETTRLKALIKRNGGVYKEINPQDYPKIYLKEGETYTFVNFAEARMESFKLASELQEKEAFDYWTWADCDDVLVNGKELLEAADKAKAANMDMVFFTYWYSIRIHEDGSFSQEDVQVDHLRERLLKPNLCKWVSRLHEIALPLDDKYQPKITTYDYNPKDGRYCVWAHITSEKRVVAAMERNIKILEIQAKEENHKDPRTVFYLAKSYFDLAGMGRQDLYQLCDLLLDDYLEKSGWAEERASAWEYKGRLRANTGNPRAAIECFHNAIKEYGNRHMAILYLAQQYFEVGDFEQFNFWLDVVLKMEPPTARTTIGNPLEVKFMAASLKVNDCVRRADVDQAIHWLKIRNQLVNIQDDPLLKSLEEARQLNESAKAIFNYSKWLKDTGHGDKLPYVVSSLPNELGREMFAQVIANEYTQPQTWSADSIVIFANFGGEFFEKWSPKNLQSGIGGSETAVIELARRWAKMGYKVTVFGDPREDEGEYEGVTYKPWYTMNWNDEFNILILWRSPHLLDRDIKARKLYMDLHDVASQLDWTDPRMDKITKVFFKSNYQRGMLPKLPDSKVAIISNGI